MKVDRLIAIQENFKALGNFFTCKNEQYVQTKYGFCTMKWVIFCSEHVQAHLQLALLYDQT